MADNNFRSSSSRDRTARAEFDPNARDTTSDPLAELARLIGQSDPYGDGGRRRRNGVQGSGDDAGASGLDWAAGETHTQEADREVDRYVPLPDVSHSDLAPQRRHPEGEQPTAARFFSGPATQFNGFQEEGGATADYAVDPHAALPALPGRPSDAPEAYDGYDDTADQAEGGGQHYAEQDYENAPAQRRRSGLIVVMAVLALAVIGTAGAFGYRAMFGGSVLSSLPPIIKASNGPNKILPSAGDSQASDSDRTGASGTGSAEQLAAPAEQPVDVQQSVKTAPRVISTIPIVAGSSQGAPPANALGAPSLAAVPPATPGAQGFPSPPMGAADPSPPASTEPKKVHTVTIRADQQGGRNGAITTSRKPNARTAPPKGDQPLSIIPGAPGAAAETPAPAAERAQTGAAPMAVASATPDGGNAAAASSGGGYAVQVTSQRTEAEAQAAFRSLKAKFPNQLGSREPILRRADLGAKGTYYRALVGPFASAEAAAEMCSSLKAAGGTCLVQRN